MSSEVPAPGARAAGSPAAGARAAAATGARAVPPGVADGPSAALNELLERVRLVDHHTHSIVRRVDSAAAYTFMLIESDRPTAAAAAGLDTQIGFAARRWCAPLLDLPPSCDVDEFLRVRLGMPSAAVAARLLPAAGLERLILDTGFRGDELVPSEQLGQLAGAAVSTVVRLETVAEQLAVAGTSAAGFAASFRDALDAEFGAGAIGVKSIVAYRFGLDFDPARPTDAEVADRAGAWLRAVAGGAAARLVDPVLLRFVLWAAVDAGRPLQVHTGYGDPDLDLGRADPLLLTDFIRATEDRLPILLLHTYPFQRNAGYLAQMFPHVFMDVGLAVNYTGAQSAQVVAESLEVAPFTKILFSSDAWGLPELHLLGSLLFRRAMSRVLGRWVVDGDWSLADAERVVGLVGSHNARRVYGLADPA
jgi:predicted TIM-barrel fold metal-dependent hydrolase